MTVRPWVVNVLVVAVLLVAGVWNYSQATQAETALCALRLNLEQRVTDSRQYLTDVRSGKRKPIPNITTADINTGIRNQQQTIAALNNLDCT